jgi:hypothetical protein
MQVADRSDLLGAFCWLQLLLSYFPTKMGGYMENELALLLPCNRWNCEKGMGSNYFQQLAILTAAEGNKKFNNELC